MKTWILSPLFIVLSFVLLGNSFAAVPGFTELPNLTAYLECRADTCTAAGLKQQAKADAKIRGTGTYQYLLGNVVSDEILLVIVDYEAPNPGYREPGFIVLYSGGSVPSNYIGEFNTYSSTARKGPITISIPPAVLTGFPTGPGETATLSNYMRGLPISNNIFVVQNHPIITVTFSNGDTAKFVYVSAFTEGGLAFRYVPGTAKDKNGDDIPNADLNSVVILMEGGRFNGVNSPFGILISNVPVYIDWQQGGNRGIITAGPLCDSEGNCTVSTQ